MSDRLRIAAQAAHDNARWINDEQAIVGYEDMLKLRAALAEAQPEPVAHKHLWFRTGAIGRGEFRCIDCGEWFRQGPPRREWVGLNSEEREAAWKAASGGGFQRILVAFADGIEAALREKNHD